MLALPPDGGGTGRVKGNRRGLLLRHEDSSERQLWIEATKTAFGATVAPLVEAGEERGLAERVVLATKGRLAPGADLDDVAAQLPSTEAIAVYDFDAERDDDLGLKTGTIVVLTETEGEWWQGHVVGAPGVVGMFPATFVIRGAATPPSEA